ncbi:hypothetical protein HDU76_014084, partial [Blyttiomyces sp. JEL0837]
SERLKPINTLLFTANDPAVCIDGPTRFNIQCPNICVSDPKTQCPSWFNNTCTANNQILCQDGKCGASVADCSKPERLGSLCSCSKGFNQGFKTPTLPNGLLLPCGLDAGVPKVNVKNFIQENTNDDTPNANKPLWDACATVKQPAFIYNDATTAKAMFFECASPPPSKSLSYNAPEFMIAYIIAGGEVILLLIHYFYKSTTERNFREVTGSGGRVLGGVSGNTGVRGFSSNPSTGGRGTSLHNPGSGSGNGKSATGSFLENEDNSVELDDLSGVEAGVSNPNLTDNLRFSGYRTDYFGSAANSTLGFTTFIWIVLLAVLVMDYYAVFSGFGFREESEMVFYDHNILSQVFILDRFASWFMKRVPLSMASCVLVEKRMVEAVEMVNQGDLVDWVRKVEARFRRMTGTDISLTMVDVETTTAGRRYIEFECVRYVFDDRYNTFQPYHFPISGSASHSHADLAKQAGGLLTSEAEKRKELVGANRIAFPEDTFYTALFKEFSGFFYVYQMMSLWIWYYYAYYYMGLVMTLVIVGSGLGKVMVYLKSQRRVLSMAAFTGTIRALRNGNWSLISIEELVPGDVIEIVASDHVVPVDAILLDGGAVCDESSLTGEALPVVKSAVKPDGVEAGSPPVGKHGGEGAGIGKIHRLYAGCHVLEAQPSGKGRPVVAIVSSTGATTSKGRLVKDILFPSPISFVFTQHLKIVVPLLILWGVFMLILSVVFLGTQGVDSWFYGMFTISQVLSPLLPAVLVIGQSVASDRLAKSGILCVDLDRITLSGKVKVYCFDKTGTLTKEGLNFLGVQPVTNPTQGRPSLSANVLQDVSTFPDPIRRAMLTCHSVTMVGTQKVGNFVDIEMFSATGAALSAGPESGGAPVGGGTMVYPIGPGDRNLHIVKRFEFVHTNAYMTVLVRDPVDNKLFVYLKGSFEKIKEICDPASVPVNYDETARFQASEGCYVLAFARREIPSNITLDEALKLSRSQLESAPTLLGLCLFRNELKPDTADALEELRDGGCRVVMITGDNADTAVFIAKKCGMVRGTPGGEPIIVMGDLSGAGTDGERVVWRNVTNGHAGNVVEEREMLRMVEDSRSGHGRPVELAVTGKAFNVLLMAGKMRDLLFDTRIFARMTPEDKVMCVRLHMEKAVTAMCGDGGNDAGALKAAHSGIALSEAESSVVSHFSSRNRSVLSCVTLLREARCSLDISFASYKYLIMYGEVLAFMGLMQYYFTVNMSQAMWILIDGTTVPLSWALTLAKPAARLARTRPTARLLGPETIASVVGQIVINTIFLIIALVLLFGNNKAGGFFNCAEFDWRVADIRKWWELADNFEGEVTGLLGTFQIIHGAAVFNIGSTYRAGFFRNPVFIAIYVSIIALLSIITLADPNPISCLFHVNCGTPEALAKLNELTGTSYKTDFIGIPSVYHSFVGHNVMPMEFRVKLWVLAMINLVVLVAWEWGVVLKFGRMIAKRTWPLKRLVYKP